MIHARHANPSHEGHYRRARHAFNPRDWTPIDLARVTSEEVSELVGDPHLAFQPFELEDGDVPLATKLRDACTKLAEVMVRRRSGEDPTALDPVAHAAERDRAQTELRAAHAAWRAFHPHFSTESA